MHGGTGRYKQVGRKEGSKEGRKGRMDRMREVAGLVKGGMEEERKRAGSKFMLRYFGSSKYNIKENMIKEGRRVKVDK